MRSIRQYFRVCIVALAGVAFERRDDFSAGTRRLAASRKTVIHIVPEDEGHASTYWILVHISHKQ
jgi:hypothetical protein